MSHLEEGLLHALLDGEIPSTELPPIQAHLAACPECRARLEAERQLLGDAEGLVGLLELPPAGTAPVRRPPARSQQTVWPRRLAWAATVILAVGMGYVARGVPPVAKQEIVSLPETVIARERSDRGDLTAKPEIATGPRAPRDNPVIAKAPSTRSEPAAKRQLAAKPAAQPAAEPKESSSGAVAAAPPASPVTSSVDETRSFDALRGNALSALRSAEKVSAPAEPITLPDAMRRLGGSLRLIDGMVPLRLEAQGPEVRLVYPAAQGELVLSQQLIDGRIVVRLIAPPGFPADSLARLRARVRQ
ncbi:MAG TPA: zf-HC2 domain-containing protein [Gemmatimonadales bacterium]|jgi:hypothetical protein|nr:zf-HC2 domain-containing protein [Gemmatimonadales bacterium]